MTAGLAETPSPPYWAVIFTSRRTGGDYGYAAMSEEMDRLARAQPGCLGAESARGQDGLGITVSYWRDEASIEHWRTHAEHLLAQERGRNEWYEAFELRIARVERARAQRPAAR